MPALTSQITKRDLIFHAALSSFRDKLKRFWLQLKVWRPADAILTQNETDKTFRQIDTLPACLD